MKKAIKYTVLIGVTVFLSCIFFMFVEVQARYLSRIYNRVNDVPAQPVGIILGAGILPNGKPSDALRDRLLVGKALYDARRIQSILISGDDGGFLRNEIESMRTFLEEQGVPANVIQDDPEGYRTYETCKRAVLVYNIKKAVLVTQRFHLGRALYLCNSLGMEVVGIPADLEQYRSIVYFVIRDIAASIKAWIDIHVYPPNPPTG